MIKRSPPKSGRLDKPAGGEMKDLKFIPTGKVYLTPGQRQARFLKYQQGVQGPLGMRRRERRRQP